jgi:serine phosphatase RsbU (regulator of sigma subunit)
VPVLIEKRDESAATAKQTSEQSEIHSQAFEAAHLRSERTRIVALLTICAGLLGLLSIRALFTFLAGHHGEAWPFAVLLAVMTAYEVMWLRMVNRSMASGVSIHKQRLTLNVIVETTLPTAALFLQLHTTIIGPRHALTSPVIFVYLLFILLSTLHLNPGLSRLAGISSAVGYALVSIYAFVFFPEASADGKWLTYDTSLSCAAALLLGGFAAGGVASQMRMYVVATLDEAKNRAKIDQLERDLDIARTIQQGLLPKAPPRIEGFDIAGWNKPADETGGDYYDWQELPDGNVALTIADVTGHGIGSALCMAACRAYARADFAVTADLRAILGRLNRLLNEDLPPEKFVTLAAGFLNPADSTLQLISAGHGPLLFYSSAEDCFRSYDAQGPPLGLLPQFPYAGPQIIRFGPGDILVLVTDGIVEWANAQDEDFGGNRIQEVIRAQRTGRAETIISELYSAVLRFAQPTPQLDDVTLLVVKRV